MGNEGWIVGDIAASVKTVYNKVVPRGGKTQWKSISSYASKNTYSRIALYVTLLGGKEENFEKVRQAGLAKNIYVFILPILSSSTRN
jgi:hypothetical protein